MTSKFGGWPQKVTGHLFFTTSGLVHRFKSICEFTVRKRSIWFKIGNSISRVTFKFDGGPWKTTWHIFYATLSFVIIPHSWVNSNWSYSLETSNSGQNWPHFVPCDLEIWRMTLKDNRAPLLCHIKLRELFHRWIQSGVPARKRITWVLSAVTLTFDLDILHGNHFVNGNHFLKMSWWYNDSNIVKNVSQIDRSIDRRVDGRTDRSLLRAAWSELKYDMIISVDWMQRSLKACRRFSNYIFSFVLTPVFNRLGRDNCKTRPETSKYKVSNIITCGNTLHVKITQTPVFLETFYKIGSKLIVLYTYCDMWGRVEIVKRSK